MREQHRKTRIGLVVSDKGDKTVIVAMEWRQRHPLYRKSVRRITRFHAHDEGNTCRV
ncbi:MAG: 30S ribosomal protein S17, partial [Chloroflexota bacterium]